MFRSNGCLGQEETHIKTKENIAQSLQIKPQQWQCPHEDAKLRQHKWDQTPARGYQRSQQDAAVNQREKNITRFWRSWVKIWHQTFTNSGKKRGTVKTTALGRRASFVLGCETKTTGTSGTCPDRSRLQMSRPKCRQKFGANVTVQWKQKWKQLCKWPLSKTNSM